MHIAYIHQHFSTRSGETGTRSYEMSRRLIARGHRVTMICGATEVAKHNVASDRRITETEVDGINVLCVNERYSNKMTLWQRAWSFFRFGWTAESLVKSVRPDLVFATSTPLTVGPPALKAARKLAVPFVFEVRDLWPEIIIALGHCRDPIRRRYLERMERRVYFAARHIIGLSPGIQQGICRTGYPRGQTSLIPNASDIDVFRPDIGTALDARFGEPGDFRLVFTGAHGIANGLDAVLDAAAELKRRGARGIKFVFIGTGREKERLIARSVAEGLQDYVRWLDPVPKKDLPAIIASMDVGLMILKNLPGFYYGTSPNKFFDYIAAGLPVLNNYPGWLAEMIQSNRCGVAVPPDNPGAFADAVLKLRDDRGELKAMGWRGRQLAEREFARDKLAEQFVEVLERSAGLTSTRSG